MNAKNAGNKGLIIALAAAFLLLFGSREFISFLVDWLFFREVGYEAVFTTTFRTKMLAGMTLGAIAFFVIFINLFIARRHTYALAGLNTLWDRVPQLQRIDMDRVMGWISLILGFFAFLFAFPIGVGYWEQALLFLNGTPAGFIEPLFGKDISFYLFTYPFIDSLNEMFRNLIVISALLIVPVYLVRGGIVIIGRLFSVEPGVKRHIGILVSLFLLSLSLSFFLDRYGLLTAEHGVL